MDVASIKDSTCRKIVYDKVQGVDYDKIGSSVAMFKVYTDYSSNHCMFRYDSWMTKMCSLDEILTKGRMIDTSKGVVNPERN